ncbi:transposase [Nonomuraea sp. NPDC050786]|uniref:transposase n=1 Tax=Nonomuraea sp. NPDC050786 TaxID=3154840 RepID=UPI0034005324
MTDEEWELLAPLLPAHLRRGHRWNDNRTMINGVVFRSWAGCTSSTGTTCGPLFRDGALILSIFEVDPRSL